MGEPVGESPSNRAGTPNAYAGRQGLVSEYRTNKVVGVIKVVYLEFSGEGSGEWQEFLYAATGARVNNAIEKDGREDTRDHRAYKR